jgi:hypothetical protein
MQSELLRMSLNKDQDQEKVQYRLEEVHGKRQRGRDSSSGRQHVKHVS